MVHAFSTSSWEVEAGRFLQFQASLVCIMSQGCIVRPWIKSKTKTKKPKEAGIEVMSVA